MVRQQTLTLPIRGSNPCSPANHVTHKGSGVFREDPFFIE